MQLRQYQREAIDAAREEFSKGTKATVIQSPTASGKSVIIAGLIKQALEKTPDARILILCHQGHLLAQNEEKILSFGVPPSKTGIYCASEGRKETEQQIILASRESLARNPTICGFFQLIIVDEAHLVAAEVLNKKTMYGKIFAAQSWLWCLGLTGTPWRLGDALIYGPNKFFESCCYKIPMKLLIDEGYLSKYIFPHVQQVIDTSDVKTRQGEYVTSDLERVSATPEVVSQCVDLWLSLTADRRCSIFFCVSRAHAKMVFYRIENKIGPYVCYLDGEIVGGRRDAEIEKIKKGYYRAIVNVGVLTTGFDAPIIDCVVMLRATQSPSLFVQCLGRGLRPHPDKDDCLMLDLAGNFDRFRSIEKPRIKIKETSPWKQCEQCFELVPRASEVCEHCRYEFDMPPMPGPKKYCPTCLAECLAAQKTCGECGHVFINHGSKAFTIGAENNDMPTSSGDARFDVWLPIETHSIEVARTKSDEPCVKILYRTASGLIVAEYALFTRSGWLGTRAKKRIAELAQFIPTEILVDDLEKKFPTVKKTRLVLRPEKLTGLLGEVDALMKQWEYDQTPEGEAEKFG